MDIKKPVPRGGYRPFYVYQNQFPVKLGLRFSLKAATPSL